MRVVASTGGEVAFYSRRWAASGCKPDDAWLDARRGAFTAPPVRHQWRLTGAAARAALALIRRGKRGDEDDEAARRESSR